MTLRTRLTLAIFVAGSVLIGSFSFVVFREAKRRTVDAADEIVRDHIEHAIDAWAAGESIDVAAQQAAHDTIAGVRFVRNGKVIQQDFPAHDSLNLMSVTREQDGNTLTVEALPNNAEATSYLAVLRKVLFAISLGTLMVLAPVAWIASARVLSPFAQLARATEALDAHSLSFRFPVPGPKDEYRALIESFNALLSRLSKAFESLHLFSAQVSHELRTPLAAIASRTESDPTSLTLREIGNDARRMGALTDQLLTLAQATHLGHRLAPSPAELCDFVDALVDVVRPRLHKSTTTIHVVPSEAPVEVFTVLPLLDVAITNLLENAVRYGGSNVYLFVQGDSTHATVAVEDDGRGLSDEQLSSVAEAFVRFAGPEQPGSGLGLTIVRASTNALGGVVSFHRSPHGGLRAELRFPKSFA